MSLPLAPFFLVRLATGFPVALATKTRCSSPFSLANCLSYCKLSEYTLLISDSGSINRIWDPTPEN